MSTDKTSVQGARQGLRRLLDRVPPGDEVVILRRGVEAAKIRVKARLIS